jgi:hypothetical protein
VREAVSELIKTSEDKDTGQEFLECNRRLTELREELALFLSQSAPDYVYWVERTGKAQRNIALNAAPLDVADFLRHRLFGSDTSVIMTSATSGTGRAGVRGPGERQPGQFIGPAITHCFPQADACPAFAPFDPDAPVALWPTSSAPVSGWRTTLSLSGWAIHSAREADSVGARVGRLVEAASRAPLMEERAEYPNASPEPFHQWLDVGHGLAGCATPP